MLRFVVNALAVLALLAAGASGASAQMLSPFSVHNNHTLTPEEIEKEKAKDRAYKAASDKVPDKKGPADPWGAIRSDPTATAKNK